MKKIMCLIALMIIANFSKGQVPSYVPGMGLISWWPFNGNANDESGNGNNGLTTGVTLTSDRFSNLNSAYNFGNGNFIEVMSNPSLGLIADLTLSSWFNCDTIYNVPGQIRAIISKHRNGLDDSGYTYGIWNNKYSTFSRGMINFSSTPYFTAATYPKDSTGDVFRNNWYHCAVTYNLKDSNLKYYINGKLVDSLKLRFYKASKAENLLIGAERQISGSGTKNYFSGKIDDVGIWNRALSECEITKLYLASNTYFTSIPIDQTVKTGSSATFSVKDTLGAGASYQWQENNGTGFVNLSNTSPYSGVTTKTLIINPVGSSMNNYQYRCLRNGNPCLDTSKIGKLLISNLGIIESKYSTLSITPNPFNNATLIQLPESVNNAEIVVSDLLGKKVVAKKFSGKEYLLEKGTMSPGVYFVHISDAQHQYPITKIVVQ
jgi:hypothetical protein